MIHPPGIYISIFCDFHAANIQTSSAFAIYWQITAIYMLQSIEHFDNSVRSYHVIRGQTAAACRAEKEWHLVLFRRPSSLSEGRFSAQWEMTIIQMWLQKCLVRAGATAMAPDKSPLRLEPSLQNVLIQLYARLNVILERKFGQAVSQSDSVYRQQNRIFLQKCRIFLQTFFLCFKV